MKKHCRSYNIPPPLSSDPQVAEYQEFLIKTQKHLKVYEFLIEQAVFVNILKESLCSPSVYYYKHIHYSNNDKFQINQESKIYKTHNFTEKIFDSNEAFSSFTNETALDDVHNVYNKFETLKNMDFLHSTQESANIKSEKRKNSAFKRKKVLSSHKMVLDRTRVKLINIFQRMCNAHNTTLKSCRLTHYLFKQFLLKKFPNEMVDAIAKFFEFKSANFEDFCMEMDRFLLSKDEKLLSLCFDAFDFNKDKYICYQDAYSLIEHRKDNLYDSDLIKLKAMFEIKKNGLVPNQRMASRRGRRQSVMSVASEIADHEETIQKREVPYIHPTKPEALTFEDFCKIEFKGKPSLLYNLFIYICNFDINKCQHVFTPVVKTRKQSEEIVIESVDTTKDLNDPKQLYYSQLERSMNLFTFFQAKDLLEKFEILRDKNSNDFKRISKASMIQNWPSLFGAKSDYISERFFYFFCGPQNLEVTKFRFLEKIFSITKEELDIKMFAFGVYDARNDGKITSDELNKIEESLPVDSSIYKECLM